MAFQIMKDMNRWCEEINLYSAFHQPFPSTVTMPIYPKHANKQKIVQMIHT